MLVGADTGRDGLHGASGLASRTFEEQRELRSAVQVGNPFLEKLLIEACLELAQTDWIVGIQDLGAAGLTSSSVAHLDFAGFMHNMIPVTIGNIIGGAIMVGVVYWLSYLRNDRSATAIFSAVPWVKAKVAAPTATAKPANPKQDVAMIGVGSKGLFEVLSRAREDTGFMARLAEDPEAALKEYDLTPMEKAALASGDIRAIEGQIGALDKALQTWLTARLSQEKW